MRAGMSYVSRRVYVTTNTQAKARVSLGGDDRQNLEHTISGWASAFSGEDTLFYDWDLSQESGLDNSSEARIVQILGLHCLSVLKDIA